jgi:hypothetical protein
MQPLQIKDCCRHLRARAPQEWQEFVTMFAEYTAEAVDKVTEADAVEIMTLKGFALANKAWLQTFNTLDPPASSSNPTPPAPIAAAAGP